MPVKNRYELNQEFLKAAKEGQVDAALRLIEQGAELDTRNADGQNAMHLAAIAGKTDMIIALIGLGATVNTIDNINWTPLHWAAERGHPETTACLLEHGAKLTTQTITGKTPLDAAKSSEDGQMTALKIHEFISQRHSDDTKRRYIVTRRNRPGPGG